METAIKIFLSKILTFKVIFPCQKSTESFSNFFSLKNIKKESNFYYCHILISLIFNVPYARHHKPLFFISRGFWVLKKNQEIMAALNHKPQHFFRIFSLLCHISPWLPCFFFFLTKFWFQERRKSKLYHNGLGTAYKH